MITICRISHSVFAALFAAPCLSGCHPLTNAEKVIGHWHGTSRTGSTSALADWQFRRDGMDTLTLTLPQGRLIAEGTWSLRGGVLTQHTTNRAAEIAGQQKKVVLVTPMETIYQYTLARDRLTLTRLEASETVVLTRYVK